MSLAECKINPIDVNFHLQKSLEILDTNSADKIKSQNYKGVKVPCLLPIRVKGGLICLQKTFKIWEYDLFKISISTIFS